MSLLERLLLRSHHRPQLHTCNLSIPRGCPSSCTRMLSTVVLPDIIWDCHTHVCDPENYPIAKSATYKPHPAYLSDLKAMHATLPFKSVKTVLVQPSTYGTDNSCLLANIAALGGHKNARGVFVLEQPYHGKLPQLPNSTEASGPLFAGIRLNFKSVGQELTKEGLEHALMRTFSTVLDNGFNPPIIQLHIDLINMKNIKSILEKSIPAMQIPGSEKVKLIIDHYGYPTHFTGGKPNTKTIAGWEELLSMMKSGRVFVKISAPYRISAQNNAASLTREIAAPLQEKGKENPLPESYWIGDSGRSDVEIFTRELFAVSEGRQVLWGSDWPHTRFEGAVDVKGFVDDCVKWCDGDEKLIRRLFWENAQELWGSSK